MDSRHEQISALIDRWHESRTPMTILSWIGMDWDQYAAWIEAGDLPEGYEVPIRHA